MVSYVVRLDGAIIQTSSGRADFAFLQVAELYAQAKSSSEYLGKIVTIHDGDSATEDNVVAVFRDGVLVGPTPREN